MTSNETPQTLDQDHLRETARTLSQIAREFLADDCERLYGGFLTDADAEQRAALRRDAIDNPDSDGARARRDAIRAFRDASDRLTAASPLADDDATLEQYALVVDTARRAIADAAAAADHVPGLYRVGTNIRQRAELPLSLIHI